MALCVSFFLYRHNLRSLSVLRDIPSPVVSLHQPLNFGYARVSTLLQENHLQLDALNLAGVHRIFQKKTSSIGKRPQLQLLLNSLRPGDCLVVYKLDRVARSLKDLLSILDKIAAAGACVRSLTEPLDTTTPMGLFMLQILGSVAQLERSMIRERAIAGQVAAYQRGTRWGGQPRVLSTADALEVYRLRETGLYTKRLLADIFNCSESTITRAHMSHAEPDRVQSKKMPVLGRFLR